MPENATLGEATDMAHAHQLLAQPIDAGDQTSPWITGRRRALEAVRPIVGQAAYVGRAGTCTWLNGVYWLEVVAKRPDGPVVVRNLTEGTKREVENVQAAMEPELLYPLLRGRDLGRWRAEPEARILMVQDPDKRRGYDEKWLSTRFPKIYAYLLRFEDELRKRSGYRRYFRSDDPFYSIFNVSDYTFAPFKVVWREVAHELDAAVVGNITEDDLSEKSVVPDHTVIMIPCETRIEADFVCAMLNSSPSRFIVKNYIVLHPDPHVLQRVRIPEYDASTPVHGRLTDLSEQAHAATAAGDTGRVREIETAIDEAAAELWGLTTAELKEIQESLAELA